MQTANESHFDSGYMQSRTFSRDVGTMKGQARGHRYFSKRHALLPIKSYVGCSCHEAPLNYQFYSNIYLQYNKRNNNNTQLLSQLYFPNLPRGQQHHKVTNSNSIVHKSLYLNSSHSPHLNNNIITEYTYIYID